MAIADTIPQRGGGTIPINEATTEQLNYWRDRIALGIEEGTAKYPDSDRKRTHDGACSRISLDGLL